MDISFRGGALAKDCNDAKRARQRLGPRQAGLVRRRLDELRAADTLAVMRTLPGARCHELRGNRKGQLSVDLDYPYLLLFVPSHDPVPTKPDGGLDWNRVTAIEVVGIEDTHE